MAVGDFPQFGTLDHEFVIRHRVDLLAREMRQLSGQVRKLPFDPYAFAERLGLTIRFTDDFPKGMWGRLRLDLVPHVIEVNAQTNQRRSRFITCHELAHLCFLKKKPTLPDDRNRIYYSIPDVQKREEQICDKIAAELLMPRASFRRYAKQLSPSLDSLESLARIFDVSIKAVLNRIRELRLWSMGTVCWELKEPGTLVCRRQNIVVRRTGKGSLNSAQVASRIRILLRGAEHFLAAKREVVERLLEGSYGYRFVTYTVRGIKLHISRSSAGNSIEGLVFLSSNDNY